MRCYVCCMCVVSMRRISFAPRTVFLKLVLIACCMVGLHFTQRIVFARTVCSTYIPYRFAMDVFIVIVAYHR